MDLELGRALGRNGSVWRVTVKGGKGGSGVTWLLCERR